VLDKKGSLPLTKNIFKNARKDTVIICVAKSVPKKRILEYHRKGIYVIPVPLKDDQLDLNYIFKRLVHYNIGTVLIEEGSSLAASVLERKLADKVLFFIAPIIIGGREALSSISGKGAEKIINSVKIKQTSYTQIGNDLLVEGYPAY
jgi:diaminohydroxyphosphoribosylaminopyrimidine deaminase/5-amino-6-(5-phosphoribosylamino)uracil reductase